MRDEGRSRRNYEFDFREQDLVDKQMTIIELCFALSIFGSAIVGGVRGFSYGWEMSLLGVFTGGLIGFLTMLSSASISSVVFTMVDLENDQSNSKFQNIALMLACVCFCLAPIFGWLFTPYAVDSVATWISQ